MSAEVPPKGVGRLWNPNRDDDGVRRMRNKSGSGSGSDCLDLRRGPAAPAPPRAEPTEPPQNRHSAEPRSRCRRTASAAVPPPTSTGGGAVEPPNFKDSPTATPSLSASSGGGEYQAELLHVLQRRVVDMDARVFDTQRRMKELQGVVSAAHGASMDNQGGVRRVEERLASLEKAATQAKASADLEKSLRESMESRSEMMTAAASDALRGAVARLEDRAAADRMAMEALAAGWAEGLRSEVQALRASVAECAGRQSRQEAAARLPDGDFMAAVRALVDERLAQQTPAALDQDSLAALGARLDAVARERTTDLAERVAQQQGKVEQALAALQARTSAMAEECAKLASRAVGEVQERVAKLEVDRVDEVVLNAALGDYRQEALSRFEEVEKLAREYREAAAADAARLAEALEQQGHAQREMEQAQHTTAAAAAERAASAAAAFEERVAKLEAGRVDQVVLDAALGDCRREVLLAREKVEVESKERAAQAEAEKCRSAAERDRLEERFAKLDTDCRAHVAETVDALRAHIEERLCIRDSGASADALRERCDAIEAKILDRDVAANAAIAKLEERTAQLQHGGAEAEGLSALRAHIDKLEAEKVDRATLDKALVDQRRESSAEVMRLRIRCEAVERTVCQIQDDGDVGTGLLRESISRLDDRLSRQECRAKQELDGVQQTMAALAEQCRREAASAADLARFRCEEVEKVAKSCVAEAEAGVSQKRVDYLHRLVAEQGSQLTALNNLLWGSQTGMTFGCSSGGTAQKSGARTPRRLSPGTGGLADDSDHDDSPGSAGEADAEPREEHAKVDEVRPPLRGEPCLASRAAALQALSMRGDGAEKRALANLSPSRSIVPRLLWRSALEPSAAP